MLQTNHPDVIKVAKAAFPSYTGRKFFVKQVNGPLDCRSAWCEGSRDYFVFVNLATLKTSGELPAQSAFDEPIIGIEKVELPAGIVCVENSIFQGREIGLTVWVRPENMTPFLPEPAPELSKAESLLLYVSKGLKSSYGGRHPRIDAMREAGYSMPEIEAAKTALIGKELLAGNGSCTIKGRNVAEGMKRPQGVYC